MWLKLRLLNDDLVEFAANFEPTAAPPFVRERASARSFVPLKKPGYRELSGGSNRQESARNGACCCYDKCQAGGSLHITDRNLL